MTPFFIVTAVKTSNLTLKELLTIVLPDVAACFQKFRSLTYISVFRQLHRPTADM
jgi:hypothetical protein